jgi:hypothetical protein
MSDAIVALALKEAGKQTVKFATKRFLYALRANDEALEEAFQEQKELILFELERAMRNLAERVEDCLTAREAIALVRPLYDEAFGSPDPERVKMLAHAMIGLSAIDDRLENKSRVQRAVRQLEPSDVRQLAQLHSRVSNRGTVVCGKEATDSLASLIQAACVMVEVPAIGETLNVTITTVGKGVLLYLNEWLNPRKPQKS